MTEGSERLERDVGGGSRGARMDGRFMDIRKPVILLPFPFPPSSVPFATSLDSD